MMPSLPTEKKSVAGEDKVEIMEKFAYLNMKTGMSHTELLNLPYKAFLSYLKHYQIFDLMSTEEGQKYLEQVERAKKTEPDFAKLRQVTGYKKRQVRNDGCSGSWRLSSGDRAR
jgi:hypothetical protein